MSDKLVNLDKNNLPDFGQEIIAEVRYIGFRKLVLIENPDYSRCFFYMYKPAPAFFCKSDGCFYSIDLIEAWKPYTPRVVNVDNKG